MIPHELQKKIDDFTAKWEIHCREEMDKLNKKFTDFDDLIKRLDSEFKNNTLTILELRDWETLRNWISDLDSTILKMQTENGTRCIECQEWIEEKLKTARHNTAEVGEHPTTNAGAPFLLTLWNKIIGKNSVLHRTLVEMPVLKGRLLYARLYNVALFRFMGWFSFRVWWFILLFAYLRGLGFVRSIFYRRGECA